MVHVAKMEITGNKREDVGTELNLFDKAPGTFGAVFEEWYDSATEEREEIFRVEQLARL